MVKIGVASDDVWRGQIREAAVRPRLHAFLGNEVEPNGRPPGVTKLEVIGQRTAAVVDQPNRLGAMAVGGTVEEQAYAVVMLARQHEENRRASQIAAVPADAAGYVAISLEDTAVRPDQDREAAGHNASGGLHRRPDRR